LIRLPATTGPDSILGITKSGLILLKSGASEYPEYLENKKIARLSVGLICLKITSGE
jgi:hypothetical protein